MSIGDDIEPQGSPAVGHTVSGDAVVPDAEVHGASEELVPRWLALLVFVLVLAVVLTGGFVIRGLVTRNQRAVSQQEIEIRDWAKRAAADPTDPKAHLGLGYAYQADGRYDKALEQYDLVLQYEPKDTAALYNRGTIYFKMGVNDLAEKSMWGVLNIDPKHQLAAKALGEYYASRGHYKSLIATVKPAAKAHPEMADLQYLLGLAYEKLNDPVTASGYYQQAVKYAPDMAAAQAGLKRVTKNR